MQNILNWLPRNGFGKRYAVHDYLSQELVNSFRPRKQISLPVDEIAVAEDTENGDVFDVTPDELGDILVAVSSVTEKLSSVNIDVHADEIFRSTGVAVVKSADDGEVGVDKVFSVDTVDDTDDGDVDEGHVGDFAKVEATVWS